MCLDIIDDKSYFSECAEDSFSESDEELFEELLIEDGLFFGDVTFHEIHERA